MYETRFGISGPPFQLTPDPSFYFDSRGHHQAIEALRRGLADESRVIAVTGEIGAGKTTMVQSLVAELDPSSMRVAQVVSTQLDALGLLQAVMLAYGVYERGESLHDLQQRFHRFLVKLDREGRRAVLVVDEAQNLAPDAFDQLGAMATWRLPRRMPLQLILVGQPELRGRIDAPAAHRLKRLIGASCHLAPLDRHETGAYIEHRLRRVGWTGKPHFTSESFDAIHRATDGVPRRINLLCSRLLMQQFFSADAQVDEATVGQAAADLIDETGDLSSPASTEPSAAAGIAARQSAEDAPPTDARAAQAGLAGALWCVVTGPSDCVKAGPLVRALASRADLPPVRLLQVYRTEAMELGRALFGAVDLAEVVVSLGLPPPAAHGAAGESLTLALQELMDRARPAAVIVLDDTEAALACASLAQERGVPIAHVGAGVRISGDRSDGAPDAMRRRIEAMANVLYTPDLGASQALRDENIAWERALCTGSLVVDAALAGLVAHDGASGPGHDERSPVDELVTGRYGYGLVVLGHPAHIGDRQEMINLLAMLVDVSRDLPLLWPQQQRTREQMKKLRLQPLIAGARIASFPAQPYPRFIGMLRNATCVLTDSWNVQEEATALGIPCITAGSQAERAITSKIGSNVVVGGRRTEATRVVWDCLFNGGRRGRVPELWDGRAAARLVAHLGGWLPAAMSASSAAPATARRAAPGA